MARINLDNEFWDEPRVELLEAKIGSTERNLKHEARGCFVSAVRLAQKYWAPKKGKPEGLIPHNIWSASGFDILIDVGLAELRDEGIYVKGSKENFQWLVERRKAGKRGGKNSGKSRRNVVSEESKQTRSKTKQTSSKTKQTRSKTKPLTLALTPTLTQEILKAPIFSEAGLEAKNCAQPEKPKKQAAVPIDPSWLELGAKWLEHSTSIIPNGTSQYPDWTPESFAKHIQKAAEHLGRNADFMAQVLDFIRQDEFWAGNAVSPGGLMRKSKNGLKKIDNIVARVASVAGTKKEIKLKTIDMENPYAYEDEFRAMLPENRRMAT